MSKQIELNADGATATITNPTFVDVLTSVLDPDKALTGAYKYLQYGAFVGLGWMIGNKRHSGSMTNFGSQPLFD